MKYFGVVVSAGLFVGLLVGRFISGDTVPMLMRLYITIGLVVLLYISALKIKPSEIIVNLKKPAYIIFISLMKMIGIPLIAFAFLRYVPEDYRIAVMLLSATPSAMATPGLLLVLKGNIKLGMIISVITNLITPITLPLVLLYSIGVKVNLDILNMMIFLGIIVFLPFLLAFLSRKFLPKFANFVAEKSASIISIHLFLFNICVIAPFANLILSDLSKSFSLFIFILAFSAILHVIAILLSLLKSQKSCTVTNIIIFAYFNVGFSIVLSGQYFDQKTTLLCVLYEVIWALGLIPLQFIFNPQSDKRYPKKVSL
ncbi:MAG: bile acid:sodium symporter [Candidatus Peregrinibacteria bacterium]|nr:bile acid:sodium symporter [Candidatus Peregrinibacteria bacterium]